MTILTVILILSVLCVSCGTIVFAIQATSDPFNPLLALPCMIVILTGMLGLAVLL